MKSNKISSVEHLQEVARFNTLQARLLTKPFAQHLKKPLAHWAVPSDKRLPLALMGLTLAEILNTPFDGIANTPGVGQKKISALVSLLARAAATDPADLANDAHFSHNGYHLSDHRQADEASVGFRDGAASPQNKEFCSSSVSEVMWEQWRASVVKHDLGKETLGRFAPKLRDVTKVIWTSKLEDYTGHTLEQIRKMKTHGEKRVRAILEAFYAVHCMVNATAASSPDACQVASCHLVLRIASRRIDKVERWILQTLLASAAPDDNQIFENFTRPLLEQIHDDASEQIASLANDRLGIVRDETGHLTVARPLNSVRQIAKDMGLTRARVYQLLNEINEIMAVRWPSGRYLVNELRNRLLGEVRKVDPSRDYGQFRAAVELFYPGDRRGAVGTASQVVSGEIDDDDGPAEGPAEDAHKESASNEKFRSRAAETNLPSKTPRLSV
jgi:hypothetical protein